MWQIPRIVAICGGVARCGKMREGRRRGEGSDGRSSLDIVQVGVAPPRVS